MYPANAIDRVTARCRRTPAGSVAGLRGTVPDGRTVYPAVSNDE